MEVSNIHVKYDFLSGVEAKCPNKYLNNLWNPNNIKIMKKRHLYNTKVWKETLQ